MGLTSIVTVWLFFWFEPGDTGIVIVTSHLPTSGRPLAITSGVVQDAQATKSVAAAIMICWHRLQKLDIRPPSYLRVPVNENTQVSRPVGVVSSSTSK